MISVIVPVYNVEQYIDECIQSIVNQTFSEIEIILINDGSTDQSGNKCEEWAKQDSRIKVVNNTNKGQAESRNEGVSIAKGELITFIDADDWIADTMIEKLYNALEQYDADIAMCEAYTQHSDGSFSDFSLQRFDEPVISIQEKKEFLLTVRYTMWSKLYKRSLFTENNIVEPNIKFEDFATVPIVYALSQKIACVDECLYYYRYRSSSTVNSQLYIDDRLQALEYMMQNFCERGLKGQWNEILKRIYMERGIVLMRQIYPLLNKKFQICCEQYNQQLRNHFNIEMNSQQSRISKSNIANMLGEYNIAVFGSYNLMIVAKIIMNMGMPDYLENHFCFSGIVSAMSEADNIFYTVNLRHKNSFRQKHLVQDFTKRFAHMNCCEYSEINYLLIDFLEERFDIGEVDGAYFTLSDAFMDIKDQTGLQYRVINKFSEEAKKLWKEKCVDFIDLLKSYVQPENVILVRSLLTERYGTENGIKVYFDNVQEIRKVNALLNEYYDFFLAHFPNVKVINTDDFAHYYTDQEYRHGCFPWHLNKKAYWFLRTRILNVMRSVTGEVIDKVLAEKYINNAKKSNSCIMKERTLIVWAKKEDVSGSLYLTLSKITEKMKKIPNFLILEEKSSFEQCYGVKVVSKEILEGVKNSYIIISSGCQINKVEEQLCNYGFKYIEDFCCEDELQIVIDNLGCEL